MSLYTHINDIIILILLQQISFFERSQRVAGNHDIARFHRWHFFPCFQNLAYVHHLYFIPCFAIFRFLLLHSLRIKYLPLRFFNGLIAISFAFKCSDFFLSAIRYSAIIRCFRRYSIKYSHTILRIVHP